MTATQPTVSAGRKPRKKPVVAKALVMLCMLAAFVALDIIALKYEGKARNEFNRAPDHVRTWAIVARDHPWSFSAAVSRGLANARLASGEALHEDHEVPLEADGFARAAQLISRSVVAPACRALAGAIGDSIGARAALEDAATRAEAAPFDRRRIGYLPLACAVVSLLLALVLILFGWLRKRRPSLLVRLITLLLALALASLQWMRVYGPIPEWAAGWMAHAQAPPVEFVVSFFLTVWCFTLQFWAVGAPAEERQWRRTPAEPSASGHTAATRPGAAATPPAAQTAQGIEVEVIDESSPGVPAPAPAGPAPPAATPPADAAPEIEIEVVDETQPPPSS